MGELQKASNGSRHLSQERAAHREWIGGRAVTLLSHYWRDDDPVELTAAIGQDWADVLAGLPRDAIEQAAIRYLRSEPRKRPTPGAIYALARECMPPPVVEFRAPDPVRAKERARPEFVSELLRAAGFAPKKMEATDD